MRDWCAKRIRTPDPRFTNSQVFLAMPIKVRILAVLGLESDLDALARDDKAGRLLQDQALPARRRRSSARAQAPNLKERAP